MAFSTGTASTMTALMTALDTFIVANGWTQDQLDTANGKVAWHRGNIYASARWNTGTPLHLGLYQALGYTGGNDPGTHPNDSGNGAVSATNTVIDDERCVESIGAGPYTYWFFEQDFYIHVCVESAADVFKHFGAGTIVKIGDWTGGEYVYGHFKTSSGAIGVTDTMLLDGLFHTATASDKGRAATIHIEGMPNQVGSGKWGQIAGSSTAPQNDTAGVAKAIIQGGFRGGPPATSFARYSAGSGSGGIPLVPIDLYYQDTANSRVYPLGYMPDVRSINMRFFAAREVVAIGGDQWYIFPAQQKSTGAATVLGTANLGIAYRRDDG